MKFQGLLAIAFCVLLTEPMTAQDKKDAKAPKQAPLKSSLDKASYGIGLNIGGGIKRDGLELNIEAMIRGLKDGLSGADPAVSETDIQAAFLAFQEEVRAKQEIRAKQARAKNQKVGDAFLATNKKKKGIVTLKSGLQYQVLKQGKGKSPKATDQVKTHYHGTLLDGTVFDSSVDRGTPATFGVNQVIKGWIEALQLMKEGDKWRLFVPAELAYGERGSGQKIGPNTVLIFEVELLEIVK